MQRHQSRREQESPSSFECVTWPFITPTKKRFSQQIFNIYFCNFFASIEQFYINFSSNSQAECRDTKVEGTKNPPHHLNALLDHLLHPQKSIDDQDTIDWCHWLVGGKICNNNQHLYIFFKYFQHFSKIINNFFF